MFVTAYLIDRSIYSFIDLLNHSLIHSHNVFDIASPQLMADQRMQAETELLKR